MGKNLAIFTHTNSGLHPLVRIDGQTETRPISQNCSYAPSFHAPETHRLIGIQRRESLAPTHGESLAPASRRGRENER